MQKMKQTVVEWLEAEFVKLEETVGVHGVMYELIEKAKAMDKEEHRKTYSNGWITRERFNDLVPDIIYPQGLDYEEKQEYAFEQYYNEHYGK
jgi:hypothetical protein